MRASGVFDRWQVRCPGKHAKGANGGRGDSFLSALLPKALCDPCQKEEELMIKLIEPRQKKVTVITILHLFRNK